MLLAKMTSLGDSNTLDAMPQIEVKHPVPLFRQAFAPDLWKEDGFTSASEAEIWSNRSCGIACVRMIVAHYYPDSVPSLAQLLRDAVTLSAYSDKGWVHEKLAELLHLYGVDSHASTATTDLDSVSAALDHDHLVIASVTHKFPTDGRRGGHLVLLTGYMSHAGDIQSLYFNDPSLWGQSHSTVSRETFLSSFTGRIILARPSRGAP